MKIIKSVTRHIDLPPLIKEWNRLGLKSNRFRIGCDKVVKLRKELETFYKECGIKDYVAAATDSIDRTMTVVDDKPDLFEADITPKI